MKQAKIALSTLLVLGACALCGSSMAQTAQPSGATDREAKQEQFDRDKVTLKDRVQAAISSADAQIDALKSAEERDKGAVKQHDRDLENKLSDLRTHLQDDLGKIDKTGIDSWSGVKPYVERDINAMNANLKVAARAAPPNANTGATNAQPDAR